MTPALSRVLKRFGIPLTPVGPKVEHRGTRLPFRYEAAAADAGMYDTLSAYAAISDASPPYQTYSRFFDDGADGESAGVGGGALECRKAGPWICRVMGGAPMRSAHMTGTPGHRGAWGNRQCPRAGGRGILWRC